LLLPNVSIRRLENRLDELRNELGLPVDCDDLEMTSHVRQLRKSGHADRDQLQRVEAELKQLQRDRVEFQKQLLAAERQHQNAAFLYRQLQLEIKRRNRTAERRTHLRTLPTRGNTHSAVPHSEQPEESEDEKPLNLPPINNARKTQNLRVTEVNIGLGVTVKGRRLGGCNPLSQRRAFDDPVNGMTRERLQLGENSTTTPRVTDAEVFQLRYCIACHQTFKEDDGCNDNEKGCRIHYQPMRHDKRHNRDAYQCCGDGTAWSSGCLRIRHIYVQIIDQDRFVITNGISQMDSQ
jgi:hypothetical protein